MTKTQSYAQQKDEICGMADYELLHYGRRPTLFRPPGGAYSDTMRQAAADCGMKAVVTWIAKADDGAMQYQIGGVLRPGDVVLMHFRPEFRQDLQAFIDAQNAAGLHTELLEDALVGE
jgi:peptidoglycan/xylan/chitin deacetylase (PgdA/CDA1 family)